MASRNCHLYGLLRHERSNRPSDPEKVRQTTARRCDPEKCGKTPLYDEALLEAAIAEGGLVIVDVRREVYWEKRLLDIDWTKRSGPWSFLLQLATKAKGGASLDAFTFQGNRQSGTTGFKSLKHYLVSLPGFPPALKQHIVSAGLRAYSLCSLPADIRTFTQDSVEKVLET